MRTKSTILDRSEKLLLNLTEERKVMFEIQNLFLEVWIDVRDRLRDINRALQAKNKIPGAPGQGGQTNEVKDR